jgi:hypothetical protein
VQEAKRTRTAELKAISVKIDNTVPKQTTTSVSCAIATAAIPETKFIETQTVPTEDEAASTDDVAETNANELITTSAKETITLSSEFGAGNFASEAVPTLNADEENPRSESNVTSTNLEQNAVATNTAYDYNLKWLTAVHEVTAHYNLYAAVDDSDKTLDSLSDDDFLVTESEEPKHDRQQEWLAAVRSTIQKYKEQTL